MSDAITITLLGEPKSTQHCYKYRCAGRFVQGYMDAKCKTLKCAYQSQALKQFQGEPLKTPLNAELRIIHGTRRVTDVDNFNKLVLDALTGIAYEDDSQIERLTVSKHYDKENPRIEVILSTPE